MRLLPHPPSRAIGWSAFGSFAGRHGANSVDLTLNVAAIVPPKSSDKRPRNADAFAKSTDAFRLLGNRMSGLSRTAKASSLPARAEDSMRGTNGCGPSSDPRSARPVPSTVPSAAKRVWKKINVVDWMLGLLALP
jgi:hypothetical protein